MKSEQRIKLIGGTIISLLAIFWAIAVSAHPNLLFRILIFSTGFGSTAWGLVQPFIWLAESIDTSDKRKEEEA